MSMFAEVQPAPPDAILGLTEAFLADPRDEKINLSVGVYKDAAGRTPVLDSVKEAERRILAAETTKSYKPIPGDPDYRDRLVTLLLGEDHPVLAEGRAFAAHTPSGTAALRVAGDYLAKLHPGATIWMTQPTWANHPQVFGAAGVKRGELRYYDAEAHDLDFDGYLADLAAKVKPGDVVLLHGCCHNPTGMDPTAEEWRAIAEAIAGRNALPMLDFAYQGFADGLSEDAVGLRAMLEACEAVLVCSSFSKNFSLYNERVGGLTVIAATSEEAEAVGSQIKTVIRSNYSNPPAHGGAIVSTILADADLKAQWMGELAGMRDRINGMRSAFAERMRQRIDSGRFDFMTRQRGMFSFSGLNKQQVQTLRDDHAIYIVGNGRINVAGMTEDNIDRLCDAVAAVL